MTDLCSKCGTQLSSPWRFCPLCGAEAPPQHQQQPSAEAEKAPMRSAFSGMFFGVIVTPMCLIVGTMLCLTGLGAILGIPMIIGGILAPILAQWSASASPRENAPGAAPMSPTYSMRRLLIAMNAATGLTPTIATSSRPPELHVHQHLLALLSLSRPVPVDEPTVCAARFSLARKIPLLTLARG